MREVLHDWRHRLAVCWAVLRGRPAAFRLWFAGGVLGWAEGANLRVARCRFDQVQQGVIPAARPGGPARFTPDQLAALWAQPGGHA